MPVFAPFGLGVFDQFVFGQPPSAVISTNVTISPVAYNGLQLNWTVPGGNWNQMVLVRSSWGVPARVWDGTVLESSSTFFGSYTDTGLQSGYFYYYSIFIYDTDLSQYLLVGYAQGLCLTDFDFDTPYQNWLPNWYLDQDTAFATGAQPDGPLVRFLGLLGYETDWIRSEIDSLFLLTNVNYISGAMLPLMAEMYGVDYEPALGMTRTRVLVKNATFLYKTKGTIPGITGAASSYSGFGCKVTLGPNLAIQLDDGAFDRSRGHWTRTSNCSLIVTDQTTTGVAPAHTAYNPANNSGMARIHATSTNVCSWTAGYTGNIQTLGIPVSQAATPPMYVLSASFYPLSVGNSRQIFAQFDWYDIYGGLIYSVQGSGAFTQTGQWVRTWVVASPPPGAVYMGRTFAAILGAGDLILMDAMQIEVNTLASPGPTAWDPPRDIKLNLLPIRQNLITNPTGATGASTGWVLTNCTAPLPAIPSVPPVPGATFALVIDASGTHSFISIAQPNIVVLPGDFCTFSFYAQQLIATPNRTVQAQITFFNSSGTQLGIPFTSPAIAETGDTTWVRPNYVAALAPAGAAKATATAIVNGAPNGEAHFIGAPLFERTAQLGAYFDGSSSPVTDYLWEGTPNLSISDYYPALQTKVARLITVMPDFTPIGSTFSVVYGAKALQNAGLPG